MKIFISIIAALIVGLIIGYIASKIFIGLGLQSFSTVFALAIGGISAIAAGMLADWSRKYTTGTICALLIGSIAYYNFLYHNYLPIKINPPADNPALVALKTSKEPQGFFTYLQIAGDDTVENYGGRRRGMETNTQAVGWFVNGLAVLFVAFFGMTGWVNKED